MNPKRQFHNKGRLTKQDQVVHSSGKKFTHGRTNGLTDIQKSDLYSEVALAKNDDTVVVGLQV